MIKMMMISQKNNVVHSEYYTVLEHNDQSVFEMIVYMIIVLNWNNQT